MALWVLGLRVVPESQRLVEEALSRLGGAIASSNTPSEGLIPLEVYLTRKPDGSEVTALLAAAALASGTAVPNFTLSPLKECDWVAQSQAALPPITAGRFYIHGGHVTAAPPPSKIPLLIEASVAFGTGRHETTQGCLLAITELDKRGGMKGPILDLGCGSGVLAMAMAALWRRPVVATDLDPSSLRVAKENAKLNGLARYLRIGLSDGYRNRLIGAHVPYGLIVANILAGPLCEVAHDLRKHLRPGGLALLSGLLATQERMVLGRHRAVGLKRVGRWRLGEWSTLLLRR